MKKILFICPKFFNYESEIREELSNDFHVEYWDERPSNSIPFKILLRLKLRPFIKYFIKSYYTRLLLDINRKRFDYVLVINPEAADINVYKKIKNVCLSNNRDCKFVLYLWDSVRNKPNVSKLFNLFDRVSTFDDSDATQYNINFMPLFYTKNFDFSQYDNKKQVYDLCFIGTAHSNRMQTVSKIISLASEERDIKSFTFFYFHNRFLFFIKKLFCSMRVKQKVNFKALRSDEVVELMRSSNIVIDINHPSQNGLTMRTIEAIGLNKKLITTNYNIKKYDFYDSKFIYVLDSRAAFLPNDFFDTQFINYKNRENYSLASWIYKNINGLQ